MQHLIERCAVQVVFPRNHWNPISTLAQGGDAFATQAWVIHLLAQLADHTNVLDQPLFTVVHRIYTTLWATVLNIAMLWAQPAENVNISLMIGL